MQGRPRIAREDDRQVGTPNETATRKNDNEDNSVSDLEVRPSSAQLVEKPVEVDEWGRQLDQRVLNAVVQAKRSLYLMLASYQERTLQGVQILAPR